MSVGEEIGMVLLDMGLVDAATPTTFTPEEIGKLMGGVSPADTAVVSQH